MNQTYSLFRSKTFYTLIAMFAGDVLIVYGHALPPDTLALFNLLLTSIAAYFHLQTGKSTSGSN